MALGTWEDFESKYGFNDGEAVEERDFVARKYLVRSLNAHPALVRAKVRVLEYDRPGCHNPCMVVVLANGLSLSDRRLLQDWEKGRAGICALPLADDEPYDPHMEVEAAYRQADRELRKKRGRGG